MQESHSAEAGSGQEAQRQRENFESSERRMTCPAQEAAITATADFSSETVSWQDTTGDTFKILKVKISPPRVLYPAKLSRRNEDRIKILAGKQNGEVCC